MTKYLETGNLMEKGFMLFYSLEVCIPIQQTHVDGGLLCVKKKKICGWDSSLSDLSGMYEALESEGKESLLHFFALALFILL